MAISTHIPERALNDMRTVQWRQPVRGPGSLRRADRVRANLKKVAEGKALRPYQIAVTHTVFDMALDATKQKTVVDPKWRFARG